MGVKFLINIMQSLDTFLYLIETSGRQTVHVYIVLMSKESTSCCSLKLVKFIAPASEALLLGLVTLGDQKYKTECIVVMRKVN